MTEQQLATPREYMVERQILGNMLKIIQSVTLEAVASNYAEHLKNKKKIVLPTDKEVLGLGLMNKGF